MAGRLGAVLIVGMAMWSPAATAQGVGFLTEHERLSSYCAGVFDARIRDINEFLKSQCTNSKRRDCREAAEELEKAKVRDRRLWDYLTRQIITSREQGKRERTLSTAAIAKGGSDWLACKQRDVRKPAEELLACREVQICLIEAHFDFLDQ
ncbi:MAG: hypothetical protein KIS73_14925 [Enhydrobacter sp.]|nr:hypothetical protein [Enhydrobacter sp.]